MSMKLKDRPVMWWGPRCGRCGQYFTEAAWDDRHDDHNLEPIHAHCCQECNP